MNIERGENAIMARNIYSVKYGCSLSEAKERTTQILLNNKFHMAEKDGDIIWVKGNVVTTGIKGIQIDYSEEEIKIYGWIQGLVGGEVDLYGLVGANAKKEVKNTIEEIMAAIAR